MLNLLQHIWCYHIVQNLQDSIQTEHSTLWAKHWMLKEEFFQAHWNLFRQCKACPQFKYINQQHQLRTAGCRGVSVDGWVKEEEEQERGIPTATALSQPASTSTVNSLWTTRRTPNKTYPGPCHFRDFFSECRTPSQLGSTRGARILSRLGTTHNNRTPCWWQCLAWDPWTDAWRGGFLKEAPRFCWRPPWNIEISSPNIHMANLRHPLSKVQRPKSEPFARMIFFMKSLRGPAQNLMLAKNATGHSKFNMTKRFQTWKSYDTQTQKVSKGWWSSNPIWWLWKGVFAIFCLLYLLGNL